MAANARSRPRGVQRPPTIVSLARALLAPGARARFIDEENQAGEWASIEDAHASGRPWFSLAAEDVLAFDLDEPHAVAAGDSLANELAAADIPFAVVASGRPDHHHLWAVIADPDERDAWRTRADALGMPPPRRHMRPPSSPHRLGQPVELLYPGADDIEELIDSIHAERRRGTGERTPLAWRDLLFAGRWPAGFPGERSGSAMVWHICIGAIRSGLALEHMRRLLADPDNAGGRSYRQRLTRTGKSHGDHWLDTYVWPSATDAAARRPIMGANDALVELDRIDQAAAVGDWSGVAGATDWAIWQALLFRARHGATLQPTMSHREIAEAAACNRRTVGVAVRRLEARGCLQVARCGRGQTVEHPDTREHEETAAATIWQLRLITESASSQGSARTCSTGGTPLRPGRGGALSRARLDVCRHGGLGLTAGEVLDALQEDPMSTDELARRLGRNKGHLRHRVMPQLLEHHLVTQDLHGRWELVEELDDALTVAGDKLGLAGKTEAVAARHEAERVSYLEHRVYTRPQRSERRHNALQAARPLRRRQRFHRPGQLTLAVPEPTSSPPPEDPPEQLQQAS